MRCQGRVVCGPIRGVALMNVDKIQILLGETNPRKSVTLSTLLLLNFVILYFAEKYRNCLFFKNVFHMFYDCIISFQKSMTFLYLIVVLKSADVFCYKNGI
jgi:hypothetical protein